MLRFLAERTGFEDRLIFEEEEWLPIANPEWAISIDDIDIFESEICPSVESTFDIDGFLREILDIMDTRELGIDRLLECIEPLCLDGEARSLPMTSEPDEIFSTGFEKFDDIAPFGRSTGRDGEWNVRGF